jgi:demethylmenaquinone methyltransferase/2-methoxy-6-polyprenyl-1,4-benzoquinol methylase
MKQNFANLKEPSLDASQRQKYVAQLFNDLAPKYDRFNRWVSFFRDETWRQKTVALLREQASGTILDLAAGTGDLAYWASRAGAREVHVFDISFRMLTCAKTKLTDKNGCLSKFVFEQGSANLMPFNSESFNGIVSGFAIRNVFHFLDEVLAEMYRILKPGGRIAILELSQPQNFIMRAGFQLHMKTVMPLIGKLTTGTIRPFNYLYETTMTFLSPQEFKKSLEKAGFVDVQWKKYLLGGIAIHYGCKL